MKFLLINLILFNFIILVSSVFVDTRNDPNCGIKKPKEKPDLGIIGGVEAVPHEFPWTAYLFGCTGSLIHPQFVLTAAHCTGISSVLLGAHNISAKEPNEIKISIKNLFLIQINASLPHDNDIFDVALAKLSKPIDIVSNPDIGTVCLPEQDDTWDAYVNKTTIAAGWGSTEHGVTDVLMKVSLPVTSMDWCAKVENLTDLTKRQLNSMICTYAEGKDGCYGDSGGPLILSDDNGRWVQVGITSWGYACAAKGHPGIWSHVSFFSDWIWRTVKENSD